MQRLNFIVIGVEIKGDKKESTSDHTLTNWTQLNWTPLKIQFGKNEILSPIFTSDPNNLSELIAK